MKRTIIILAMLAVLPKILIGTEVCGNVSGVWSSTGSPYHVTCDVSVPAGQTLEIRPGVQVLFTGHYKFNVYGNLQSIGTEQDSIIFTRAFQTEESKWWGMRFYDSASDSSQLRYCIIEQSRSFGPGWDGRAGGVGLYWCSPHIAHCTFRHNVAGSGGGLDIRIASPVIEHCAFLNNAANDGSGAGQGGGILVDDSAPIITNCLIANNYSDNRGGGVEIWNSSPTISQCTFYGNSAAIAGGGLWCGSRATGDISNSIVWQNAAPNDPNVHNEASSTFSYSDVQGGYPGEGNIDANPRFVDSANGDFHLQTGSPCINAGDPTSPRDPDCTVADMGAFPFLHSSPGLGFVTAVSMGPPNWEYELHWLSGCLNRLTFKPVCGGTNGWTTGAAAAAGWNANVFSDSVVFTTATQLTSGSLSGFVLSHPWCSHPLMWFAGDSSGTIDGPLPVELLGITVAAVTDGIELQWNTASETDNDFFEIMRGTSEAGAFARITTLPSQGNSASGHSYEYLDRDVTAGQTYWYYLADVDMNGNRTEHREMMRSATMTGSAELPSDYSLSAYPNPFNPSTTISFALPEADVVRIAVFDVAGRWIQTLVNEQRAAGNHTVTFDARELPSGVYFARMESGPFAMTKKIALIR